MKTTTNFRTTRMVQLALFIAIILLMTFTPIGYIKTLGLSITLIGIPVLVGAIVLGPTSGAILGAVFGITSFAQCFGLDPFGTMLFGINPVGTFILCMVPRILMGWLSGLIFIGFKKIDKTRGLSYAITSLTGSLFNTVLFMTTLMLIFYKTPEIQKIAADYGVTNAFALVIAMVAVNAVAEAIVCLILGTAISKAVDVFVTKNGMR